MPATNAPMGRQRYERCTSALRRRCAQRMPYRLAASRRFLPISLG